MAKTLIFRNDTTSGLAAQAGSLAELFVDITKKTVVVMDGSTPGGFPLATQSDLSSVSSNAFIAATTKATTTSLGIVRADGTSILVTSGVISANVRGDNTSIVVNSGIIQAATSSNGYGTRTISTGTPSGGNPGDIWYQV